MRSALAKARVSGRFVSPTLRVARSLSAAREPLFVKTEETPNPRSLKFVVPGHVVLDTSKYGLSCEFKELSQARNVSPLASSLLQIDGVSSVFFGSDFVTVNREDLMPWGKIRPAVTSKLMSLLSDKSFEAVVADPRVAAETSASADEVTDPEDEVVELILELLEQRIRPMVMEDGGDIHFESWAPKSGVVRVRLSGSCVGCPSSLVTLKHGVEQMLKHYIPEVVAVEEVPDDADADDAKLTWETQD